MLSLQYTKNFGDLKAWLKQFSVLSMALLAVGSEPSYGDFVADFKPPAYVPFPFRRANS